jgi:hypothetical protein
MECSWECTYLKYPEAEKLDGEHGGASEPRLIRLVVEAIESPAYQSNQQYCIVHSRLIPDGMIRHPPDT